MPTPPAAGVKVGLADPSLHRMLSNMIRGRVPAADVDDVVQATLTDALAAQSPPEDPEAFRKWVVGIARHKIADYHRRGRRERPEAEVDRSDDRPAHHDAKDLLRWAEREVGAGEGETLDWMLREGDGEKLETIADEHQLPAPRVRQRVSRMRRFFRERWAAELAAVAVFAIFVGVGVWFWRSRQTPITGVGPDASAIRVPGPDMRKVEAMSLRRLALERCANQSWQACLDGLDRAAALDPEGDKSDDIVRARQGAAAAAVPSDRAPVPPAPSGSSVPAPVTTDSKAPPIEKMAPPKDGKKTSSFEGKYNEPTEQQAADQKGKENVPPTKGEGEVTGGSKGGSKGKPGKQFYEGSK